ncbi:DUF4350 domain-containing protein [Paenibacillus filicis]|uniref:DUF4350 domain-containing protein n=1 Tax=Paenibacillus filicis TaxID=669464 RepID=A0ABU9DTT8_9BACL
MLKRNKQRIALLLSVLAFLIVGYVLVKPDLPKYAGYVSVSPAQDGTKGLFDLLKESGEPVKPWRKPWKSLPQAEGHTMVSIQPNNLTARELEDALDWVERGNDLLLFHASPPDGEPFEFKTLPQIDTAVVSVQDRLRPAEAGWTASIASGRRIGETDEVEPLLQDEHGVIAARLAWGEGTVTLLLVPEWTRNDAILTHSNFELLWPYLPRGRKAVWFDDYHHGMQETPGFLAVYPGWLLAILAQLTVGALLWLWMKAVRFGPAYTPRAWTVRRGDETLIAAAGWYERRGLAREALAHQEAYIRSLARAGWGVRIDATDSQLLATARQHWDKPDVDRLGELLVRFQRAREAALYGTKQLERDSRAADELISKLERK